MLLKPIRQPTWLAMFFNAKNLWRDVICKKDYVNPVIFYVWTTRTEEEFPDENISTYIRQEIYLERLLELSVQPRIDKRLFRQNVSNVILTTSYPTSVLNHVRITSSGEAGRPSSRAFGTARRPSRTDEKNSVYSLRKKFRCHPHVINT